jgi:hypothetical protein
MELWPFNTVGPRRAGLSSRAWPQASCSSPPSGLFNDTPHARRVMMEPEVRKALADIATARGLLLIGINVYDMQ